MRPRSLLPVLVAVFLPAVLPGAGADPSGRIPPYIASRHGPSARPAWISASVGVNAKGGLNMEALPMGLRRSAQRQIESGEYQKQGCIQTLEVEVDLPPDLKARGTFRDLTRNSQGILRGTVTDMDPGFGSYGSPALLLEVKVEERMKGSAHIADAPYIYFEYPVAAFEAGGYRFCKKDSRWPEPPELGDSVMLFPYLHPVDEAAQIIVPLPEGFEVMFERRRNGVLNIPKALQNDPDLIGVKRLETVRERTSEQLKAAGLHDSAGSAGSPTAGEL